MPFASPYTVTVSAINGGVAQCSYFDVDHQPVPAGQPLSTSTQAGLPGELIIGFTETVVAGTPLRLVGAGVKTVGGDPIMNPYNFLAATRAPGAASGEWVDALTIPWGPDKYTLRGVVLLFAQVDANGNVVCLIPSTDPQIKNDEA